MVAPASSPPLPPISTLFSSLSRPGPRQTPSTPSPLPSFEAAFSSINVVPSPSTSPSSPPAWIGSSIRRPDSAARLNPPRLAAIRGATSSPSSSSSPAAAPAQAATSLLLTPSSAAGRLSPPGSPGSLSSATSTAGSACWPAPHMSVAGAGATPFAVSVSASSSSSSSSSPRRAPARSPPGAATPNPAGSSADRYSCSTCQKSFSRPSSLRIHSHSHTGEKPFKCSHVGCGKAFSVRSNMKRHERGCHAGAANAAAAAQAAHAAATAHSDQHGHGHGHSHNHSHGHPVYSHMSTHGYLRMSA